MPDNMADPGVAKAVATDSPHHSLASETCRLITAAIDFGTSSSGFAFAYNDNIDKVHVNKWIIGSSETDKAPTTVLLKPDKTFDSFGYVAESKYAELCDDGEQKGWRYFQDFKLVLYQQEKISRDMEINDQENKSMCACDVFSAVLAQLKKHILKAVNKQREKKVSEDDVMYVITVPAIWSDAAKQFMREAATNKTVGITNDQLRLVLEPEAAAVYCAQKMNDRSLPVGYQYILVDLGGGTVDISTHEVLKAGLLHELHVARGNDFGGQYFNRKCIELLKNVFGEDCFERWKTTNCYQYLNMLGIVEGFKKKVGGSDRDVDFIVPNSLLNMFKESCSKDIDSLESDPTFRDSIKRSKNEKGQIWLKNKFLRNFLEDIVRRTEQHLNIIISEFPNIQTLFLVGGLAKSDFIYQLMKSKFPQYSLIVPEDPGVAVLKGAVLLGNRPQIIACRKARYSYGIGAAVRFEEGKHREDYKITRDGEILCINVFKELIEKGQVLKYGDSFTTTTYIKAKLPETKQVIFTTYLYQSTQPSPTYYTDEGCTKLGGVKECPPEEGWPDYCESTVEIVVGEAEFKFYMKNDLGHEHETQIDFLLPD